MARDKTAIIIGAGPAGITAAYELLQRTDIKPIIFEATGHIGGISRTIQYKGNRLDLGGHRFFSKSEKIMRWWTGFFAVQNKPSLDEILLGLDTVHRYGDTEPGGNGDPQQNDKVFLVRKRISRIFFSRKFFDYPVSLNSALIKNLGVKNLIKIGLSYLAIKFFPVRDEKSLEDFFINRFGKELYLTFFKDYTEKVWGRPCNQIRAEWGEQRVKGLSISKTLSHAMQQILRKYFGEKIHYEMETSLIDQFWYPKLGPGHFWETVAGQIVHSGGEIHLNARMVGLCGEGGRITSVEIAQKDETARIEADYFFSTMPVQALVSSFKQEIPAAVREVANGLQYRSFMTAGLLLKKIKIKNTTNIKTLNGLIPDNWIYVQERDVRIGRLQIFNNWSPYMVRDLQTVWMGLEFFCDENDSFWNMDDESFIALAVDELIKLGFIDRSDVLDSMVIKVPKAYPAYFGTYEQFDTVKQFVDRFENLFLIGRNGMHRYNNMDHSMLTAITAVDAVCAGVSSKDAIWAVNMEASYHEEN